MPLAQPFQDKGQNLVRGDPNLAIRLKQGATAQIDTHQQGGRQIGIHVSKATPRDAGSHNIMDDQAEQRRISIKNPLLKLLVGAVDGVYDPCRLCKLLLGKSKAGAEKACQP